MDTEKQWDAFEKNDTQFRKSESVQQDIQQILDTVTQIKTDVDQLKGENTEATGPVDTEPALSAPEDNQPPAAPPMDMSGAAPGGETPQEPMGGLMAQPEDGAATPTPAPQEPAPEMPAEEAVPPFFDEGDEDVFKEQSDEDKLLQTAMEVDDPELKQQIIALVYQSLEAKKAPAAPPMEEQLPPGAEEVLAAAMDANGDGMISEDEIEPMMRSADSESVQCDANPADAIKTTEPVAQSDDEKKDDEEEKKDDDDKKDDDKKEEPGVNDGLPSKEEDKDSTEDLPEVTEVKVETEDIDEPEEQTPEETSDEKEDAIDSIIDSVLEDAKERIKEQVIEAVDGIDAEHGPFMLSTAEMMKSRRTGGSHRSFKTGPIKKSIEWPESFEGVSMEDKCRYFAKSFSQMPAAMQDNVVTLMDTKLGSDVTSSIFKSEGVDLDSIYESVKKGDLDNQPYTSQAADNTDAKKTAAEDNGGMTESCEESTVQESDSIQNAFEPHKVVKPGEIKPTVQANEKKPKFSSSGPNGWASNDSTIQNSDDTESLEACAKSAGIGMHIPTVNEMMSFRKSHTSMYTAISREAAEPHGIVDMGTEQTIPSVKDMFAKRFGRS